MYSFSTKIRSFSNVFYVYLANLVHNIYDIKILVRNIFKRCSRGYVNLKSRNGRQAVIRTLLTFRAQIETLTLAFIPY